MGNCGCAGENSQEIDEYMRRHHKGKMKYETSNYELAKQDREAIDKNLVVAKNDLSTMMKPLNRKHTDRSLNDGEENKSDEAKTGGRQCEIDEEMIKEMCKFSNMSTSNNVKKASGNGTIIRVNGGQLQSLQKTKNVVEDYNIDIGGDFGTDGRPRVKEEERIPPNYEQIDLNDPEDKVLFQGELYKYKSGYNPTFIIRFIQVTSKALKYFKNKCNAVTCCSNKPLTQIPLAAIKKVERVNFDLILSKKEKEKSQLLVGNQFEIFLKEGFLDYYLKTDYEQTTGQCSHSCHHTQVVQQSPSKLSQFESNIQNQQSVQSACDKSSSPIRGRTSSPGKVRIGAESHEMTIQEMKLKYLQLEEGQQHFNLEDQHNRSVNIFGSWSNREQEWYFTNKRLLFTTKDAEEADFWIEKLNALITDP